MSIQYTGRMRCDNSCCGRSPDPATLAVNKPSPSSTRAGCAPVVAGLPTLPRNSTKGLPCTDGRFTETCPPHVKDSFRGMPGTCSHSGNRDPFSIKDRCSPLCASSLRCSVGSRRPRGPIWDSPCRVTPACHLERVAPMHDRRIGHIGDWTDQVYPGPSILRWALPCGARTSLAKGGRTDR
jgi:hypothetical protein